MLAVSNDFPCRSQDFPEDMVAALNTSANPCEDFYEYSCGGWANVTSIPSWQSGFAKQWDGVTTHVQKLTIDLLEKDKGPAGTFYQSCMDTDTIQTLGASPLKPWLAAVDKIVDHDTLMQALIQYGIADINVFFSWWVDGDALDSSIYAFFVAQGGTSMPDQSYYTTDSKEMEGHRAAYKKLIKELIVLSGLTDEEGARDADNVMDVETALAKAMTPRDKNRDEHGVRMTLEELQTVTPSVDWALFLQGIGAPRVGVAGPGTGGYLNVKNADWMKKLDVILSTIGMDKIQSYMRWQAVYNYAPFLDFHFEHKLLAYTNDVYGISVLPPRWRKCFFSTTGAMAMRVSKLFVDGAFPEEARKGAQEMLREVRFQFNKSLTTMPWMDEVTREKAQGKLARMFLEVGRPTTWPASASETFAEFGGIRGNAYFDNCVATNSWTVKDTVKRLNTKVERRRWGSSTSATDVNAFYSRKVNGVFIPAGILQDPFFSQTQAAARNYGSVGAICGHEMTHGFDDVGREYNKDGKRSDWWTSGVVESYKERAKCIEDLMSSYEFWGRHVNGKLVLGESIADSGGLRFSWDAFVASQKPEEKDKRTFFLALGQTWCSKERLVGARASLLTDSHPPNKFRVIGALSQFQPFAEAFNCPVGSAMNPVKKCDLW